jgi:hypothetical protein
MVSTYVLCWGILFSFTVVEAGEHSTSSRKLRNEYSLPLVQYCSVSRWRPQKVDKRMVLEHTHGLFIT